MMHWERSLENKLFSKAWHEAYKEMRDNDPPPAPEIWAGEVGEVWSIGYDTGPYQDFEIIKIDPITKTITVGKV
jgi:hypothetical protein